MTSLKDLYTPRLTTTGNSLPTIQHSRKHHIHKLDVHFLNQNYSFTAGLLLGLSNAPQGQKKNMPNVVDILTQTVTLVIM